MNIALRGREHRFTTPGGDVQITAQAVSTAFMDGLKRFGWTVGVLFVLALIAHVVRHHATAFDRPAAWAVMFLLGILSIGLGIFPLFGAAAVVTSAVVAIRRRLARRVVQEVGAST